VLSVGDAMLVEGPSGPGHPTTALEDLVVAVTRL